MVSISLPPVSIRGPIQKYQNSSMLASVTIPISSESLNHSPPFKRLMGISRAPAIKSG